MDLSSFKSMDELKALFPGEWILLGNPVMRDAEVLGGIPVFHSRDKKEVCYLGRDKTSVFEKVTVAFAGNPGKARKIGIMRRL